MSIENFKIGKGAEQIIQEVIEDMDRGLYDVPERREVMAKLITARITTMPESAERNKIDELMKDIRSRYGSV
jgi:hypothetical protein